MRLALLLICAVPAFAFAAVPESIAGGFVETAADAVAVAIWVLLVWVVFLTIRLLRKPFTDGELSARHARYEAESERYLKSMEAKANPVSGSAYKSGPM